MIEKSMVGYKDYDTQDTIFEYAICSHCAMQMESELSHESLDNLRKYFGQLTNLAERRQKLLADNKLNVEPWIGECIIKGTPRNELAEYNICCQCEGKYMVFSYLPYMIGSEAMEEMNELLSKQTIGEIDDFVDEHFGLPPELKELLKEKPAILV
jgi:hypothetical protein